MDILRIDSPSHSLYETFARLYADSFPLHEQRTEDQQQEAFSDDRYRLYAFMEDGRFVGFISCWLFGDYVYVEHFAVVKNERGRGTGSRIMKMFQQKAARTVILEIDPVCDELTTRRMNFYIRCGFCLNSHAHVHPPYRRGYAGHSLTLMTWPYVIDFATYAVFADDLRRVVMRSAADANNVKQDTEA